MASIKRDHYILLEGVDSNLKLSEVVDELSPEMTSIVSIYRIHDYDSRRNSESIILSLLDDSEYRAAVAARDEINSNNDFTIEFPDVISGTAYFETDFADMNPDHMKLDPKPLYVYDLPRKQSETSVYLIQLLKTIESCGVVTGFKWTIDYKRYFTRNFGFAMLNSKSTVLRLAGMRLMVDNNSVRLNTSNGTCVIVHSSQQALFDDFQHSTLTPALSRANWLQTNVIVSYVDQHVERDNIKVTIQNDPAPVKAIQSAPIVEYRDDTLIIEADNNDLYVSDMEIDPKVAETANKADIRSRIRPDDQATASTSTSCSDELQQRPTVKAIAPKTIPIGVSRFIKMKMKGIYTFATFYRRVMQFIRSFEDIAYFDQDESATAYIAFKEVKHAAKFKQRMEALVKNDDTKFSYEAEKGPRIIQKVKDQKRRPKEETEIIYHINASKEIKRCMEGGNYTEFVFPSADNVPK